MPETILQTEYSEEMQKSYLDYSMSVITARAIPDARDGLKPVQRRVLYDMSELRLNYDKPHRKSARIVGDTMGKYHPHGDSSIYETLVVLSQAWKKGMPLIDGHGNFGSIEGDGAAAMRYTEAKLKKFTQDVYLKDLDKTVNFISNYDETETEPEVLPVRIPNLLINGAEGIAVGMSTSIPPHNLAEVCDTCIEYIKNNMLSTKELLTYLKGPDFPTGAIISNKSDLLSIYETGYGRLKLRAKIEVELGRKKSDKDKLIISEIPYTMIGSGINKFLIDVANLVENKTLADITDISNQSDKDGTRIVLDLKKDADIERIKAILYKKTKLEDTFSINMLAIVDGKPETLGLRGILKNYLDFQYENNTKKYKVLLDNELDKKEVQEGLIRATDIIDLIIAILRGSKNINDAKACLVNGDTSKISFKNKEFEKDARNLNFTERQAGAILDMRLYRLIGLEIDALLKSHKETLKKIKEYEKILKSKKSMDELIIKDLEEIKSEYSFLRKTLIEDSKEVEIEEVKEEARELIFVMDKFGYSKLLDKSVYEKNSASIEADYKYIIPIMSDDKIYIFTDIGFLHQIKASDIPLMKLKDKGIPIDNKSKFDSSKEEILLLDSFDNLKAYNVLFATGFGLIKQVSMEEFITNNKTVSSTKLSEGDKLIAIKSLKARESDVFAISNKNYTLRFSVSEVNLLKKISKGEKLMKLNKDEKISALYLSNETSIVLVGDKELNINKYKLGHRNDRGTKLR